MTVRVVPLRSDEASDNRVAGTAEERLAILADLSRRTWALTSGRLKDRADVQGLQGKP
jgi:hypothetical protein